MRGGFIHSRVIADELASGLRDLGARVETEYPVRRGSRSPAVDIYAVLSGIRIVCEIELGPRRVFKDLQKAQELDADWLLVVAATPAQTAAIRRCLEGVQESRVQVRVMPFGAALRFLSELSAPLPLSNEETKAGLKDAGCEGSRKPVAFVAEAPLPLLLTAANVARLLCTTRKAVYAMVARRRLRGVVRVGRRLLFRRDELIDSLGGSRTPSPKEIRRW